MKYKIESLTQFLWVLKEIHKSQHLQSNNYQTNMNHIVFPQQQSLEKTLIKFIKRKSQEDKLLLYLMFPLEFNNKKFHHQEWTHQDLLKDFKFKRGLQAEEDSIKYWEWIKFNLELVHKFNKFMWIAVQQNWIWMDHKLQHQEVMESPSMIHSKLIYSQLLKGRMKIE